MPELITGHHRKRSPENTSGGSLITLLPKTTAGPQADAQLTRRHHRGLSTTTARQSSACLTGLRMRSTSPLTPYAASNWARPAIRRLSPTPTRRSMPCSMCASLTSAFATATSVCATRPLSHSLWLPA